VTQNGQTTTDFLHAPDKRIANFVRWYEGRRNGAGLTWDVPAIDKKVIPMHAGDLIGIMGRPGHGKTSLLAFLAKRAAMQLEQQRNDKECVVFVAWEGTAEEIEAYMMADDTLSLSDLAWARLPTEDVIRLSAKNAGLPLYVIAHSIFEETASRMTPETVFDKVQRIEEQTGRRPRMIALDYIQIMELDDFYTDRTPRIIEATIRAKEMAKRLAVPVVMGVQANRRVDDRNPPIPQQRDAEYTSAVEQNCDKLFGLWRPAKTHEIGTPVQMGSYEHKVNETLLIMRLLKQRFESASGTWALQFDPSQMLLGERVADRS
jgi:replicative DNA helicase